MKFERIDPPRTFEAGFGPKVQIKDCGRLALDPDEQVTFVTDAGAEYDVARKDWGFYATPSLNGRLERFGLHGVLVRNRVGHYFVMLVEEGKEPLFYAYVASQALEIVCHLDKSESLDKLAAGAL